MIPAPPIRSSRRRAFTLTELLTTMGLIILVIAMALPVFDSFSGSRSVDSGQNILSAMLQRARTRAIGLQQRRGVFFFDDPATRKVAMTFVRIDETQGTVNVAIMADPEIDSVEHLPMGVGAAFFTPTNSAPDTYKSYGLVLFDGLGRAETRWYSFSTADATLSKRLGNFTLSTTEPSQVGMMLYDKRMMPDTPVGTAVGKFGPDQVTWLTQNGAAMLVNRYNGTLTRGE